MYLSIIVPLYNEEENVELMCSALQKALQDYTKEYEILFVNDGSTDQTLEKLKVLLETEASVKVISLDRNYGKTATLDAGIKNAEGKFIVTMDGDLQHDPEYIVPFIEELEKGEFDAVFGVRKCCTAGLLKAICTKVAVGFRNFVLNENYRECYYAAYRSEAIKQIPLYNGFQDFIAPLLTMEGYQYKQIEITEYPRRYGKSKYGFWNRIFKGLSTLFIVNRIRKSKLRYTAYRVNVDNIQKYFDRNASKYATKKVNFFWKNVKSWEKDALLNSLSPAHGDKILDAGCGDGYYLSILAEQGFDVEGFDFSPQMVAEAQKYGVPVKVKNLESEISEAQVYDKILCAGVFEFCRDAGKMLSNLQKLLRAKGTIVLFLPRSSFSGQLYKGFHKYFGCGEEITLFSLESIKSLVNQCNLQIKDVQSPTAFSYLLKLEKPCEA